MYATRGRERDFLLLLKDHFNKKGAKALDPRSGTEFALCRDPGEQISEEHATLMRLVFAVPFSRPRKRGYW